MTWRALLDGGDAARARDTIERIAGELERREIVKSSLGAGLAGVALLHGYRALAGDEAAADSAAEAIERGFAGIARHPVPWLFSGYAGTAFVLRQLAPVIGEADEAIAELDALIAAWLDGDTWRYLWDLMHGLVGLGVYALEAGDRTMLAQVIRHLDARALRQGDRVTWLVVDDNDASTYSNLGVAHGVAGAIGLLAEVCELADPPPAAAVLLRGAVAWLRDHERPGEHPRYGQTIGDRVIHAERFDGWCYGDPSTALVLAHAGRALGDDELSRAARTTAHAAARRTAAELATLSLDAGLCHGTLGRAHIFNRMGQALFDDELLAAARRSYAETLDRCDTAGLAAMEPGLRGGIVGIGLGLLAAITPVEPRWDRAFLLALRRG